MTACATTLYLLSSICTPTTQVSGLPKRSSVPKAATTACSSSPMAYAGRYVVENEQAPGLCKVLVDENDTILGCHILGIPHRSSSSWLVLPSPTAPASRTSDATSSPTPQQGRSLHEVLFS